MRRANSVIITDFITEKGEDGTYKTFFAYIPLEQMVCYAVAESYDNDTDINSAKLAVESVLVAFERNPSLNKLKQYIKYAHDQLIYLTDNGAKNRLEASIAVIVSDYTRIRYASCGNVKFYLLDNNALYKESDTETYYQFAAKYYGLDKAPMSENRNLLQYLGKEKPPVPFVSKKIELPEGCTMLLATCEIWEKVASIEILDAYEHPEPRYLIGNIRKLYDQYNLSQSPPAPGKSYSLVSIFVEKAFKEDTAKKKKRSFIIFLITGIVLLLIIITTAFFLIMRANDRSTMSEIEELNREGVRYSNYGNYIRAYEQFEEAQGVVDKLNMKNWQYINEKRTLSNTIKDRLILLRGIQDGDVYMESGDYRSARSAYQSVESFAKSDLELRLSDVLLGKLSLMNAYLEISDYILLGEIYEISEQYANALLYYTEASDKAKNIDDLEVRKNLRLRILELNNKIADRENQRALTVLDEREQIKQELIDEQMQRIQSLSVLAAEAVRDLNYLQALQYYEQVLKLYRDLEILDDRYIMVVEKMAEIEKMIIDEEASRNAAQSVGEVE